MESSFLVPIALFAMIAAIVIVPKYFKTKEREKLQDTLRAAIEKGQPLPPEVIQAITTDVKVKSPGSDLRTGLIWLGVAAGIAAFGFAVSFEESDALYPLLGIAAFPGFVGLAFLILAMVSGKKA